MVNEDIIIGYHTQMWEKNHTEFSYYINMPLYLLERLLKANYGNGLKLILISYFFDGDDDYKSEDLNRISNYSKKNQDIGVDYVVRHEAFHNKDHEGKKRYIYNTTIDAIQRVKERLKKKKEITIDFDLLEEDVKAVFDEWMSMPFPKTYKVDFSS
jgi:hypothetical protein